MRGNRGHERPCRDQERALVISSSGQDGGGARVSVAGLPMLYGPANNPLLPIDAAGMNLMQEPYSTDASELLPSGEAESSTAGVLPLASTRASPDFLAPLRAYIASDAFIDGICTEGFRHPKMISNLSGSGPGTLMYDRFINACRTRIAEHSKAAAAQGKEAHTSSPRDSKPPCVLIVFHGTADENIEAICRDGLDPARRGANGQAFGPGEYFGTHAWTSLAYCRPSRHTLRQLHGPSSSLTQSSLFASAKRMLVFAVLVGGATSANGDKPDRSIRQYGRDSYVIIEDSQSHLPLGVLEWDGIGNRDLIQRAQNHAAMTRQAAEAQSREAQKAEAQAKEAKSCARVQQLIIQERLDEASELYQRCYVPWHDQPDEKTAEAPAAPSTRQDALGQRPPPWAAMLHNLLASRSLDSMLLDCLFPHVVEIATAPDFEPCFAFNGYRAGRVYAKGESGLGYYADRTYQAPSLHPQMSAANRPPQVTDQPRRAGSTACLNAEQAKELAPFHGYRKRPLPSEYTHASLDGPYGGKSVEELEEKANRERERASRMEAQAALAAARQRGIGTAAARAPALGSSGSSKTGEPLNCSVGSRVVLHSMQTQRGRLLNGCHGTIRAWDAALGRFHVRVDSMGQMMAVKPENVSPESISAGHGTSASGGGTAASGLPRGVDSSGVARFGGSGSSAIVRPASPTPNATRMVLRELKKLTTATHDSNVRVTLPNEADVYVWNVELFVSGGSPLSIQLDEYAKATGEPSAVKLEVRFDGGFPSSPPFVRVITPRFAFHTGHVTIGGSICMAELTSSGWNPEFTIECVLNMILSAMLDGNATLHATHAARPYSLHEAQMAFNRVASQHGWG